MLKLLGGSTRKAIKDISLGNNFLNHTLITEEIRPQIGKGEFRKLSQKNKLSAN